MSPLFAARTGDAALAANLVKLAARFRDLSSDEQTVVRHLIGTWVKEA